MKYTDGMRDGFSILTKCGSKLPIPPGKLADQIRDLIEQDAQLQKKQSAAITQVSRQYAARTTETIKQSSTWTT